jgi:hypothetical protein
VTKKLKVSLSSVPPRRSKPSTSLIENWLLLLGSVQVWSLAPATTSVATISSLLPRAKSSRVM